MRLFTHLFISALAVTITAYLLSGVHIQGFVTALGVAVVLALINGFVRPLLILLTLPLTILSLGLFLLILNTLLIMLAGAIVPGFGIDGFWWAFLFGIILTVVNSILNRFLVNTHHSSVHH